MNEDKGIQEVSRKEVPASRGFDLTVDREKLAQLDVPEGMKSWLTKLPERLRVREAVTLIVGENGTGKTSLARAIASALGKTRPPDDKSMKLYLNDGEPAQAIVQALTPLGTPKGNLLAAFMDGSKIMREAKEWQDFQLRSKQHGVANVPSNLIPKHRLSNRQLFEQSLDFVMKQGIDSHRKRVIGNGNGDVIIILDEPEHGLSPRRQLDLPQVLKNFPRSTDTLLVPTNNLALYASDLPRLDLDYPERGVFRPSDYGEVGKIELPQSANVQG